MAKEATLKIGNSLVDSSTAIASVAEAIVAIFKAAKENGIEQVTIQHALETLGKISKIENVTVTNSVFKGDKTVNMDSEDEEESEE